MSPASLRNWGEQVFGSRCVTSKLREAGVGSRRKWQDGGFAIAGHAPITVNSRWRGKQVPAEVIVTRVTLCTLS